MKPSRNPFLRSAALLSALSIAAMICIGTSANAASDTWGADADGEWGAQGSWAGSQIPGSVGTGAGGTTTTDDAIFDGAGNYIVYTAGNRGIRSTTFSNTGTTTILGGTTAATGGASLYLFGNLTVNAGAGAVTIGDTASTARQVVIRTGTLSHTNNSSNLLTLANAIQTRGSSGSSTSTFTFGGSGNTLISGVVGGGGGSPIALSKTGTGVLTLSGANTYGSGTTVTVGTLTFRNIAARSTSGSGNHVFSGATTLGLGVGSTTGFFTDADITSAFALTGVGTGNLARISVTATTNVGIDTTAGDFERAAITGAPTKGLAKLGSNMLTLTGANTYTGITSVSGGTLKISSTGVINNASTSGGTGVVIGGSTLDIDGGTVTFNGATALAVGDNNTAGNVIVRAGSTLNLTGGNIAIGQGSSGVANTPVSTFTQLGGTTKIDTGSTLYVGNYRGATMSIQGGSLTSLSSAIIGVRSNSSMTISGETTTVAFSSISLGLPAGSLLPTADLNLNGGTLTLGANGIIKTVTDGAKTVSFNGGTLKAGATSTDFINADAVFVKTNGATIDTDIHDVTIDNPLLQFETTTGSLRKSGAGKLTLTAANTYTGSTAIQAGTLALGATGSIADSASTTIAPGASLETVLQSTYTIPAGKPITFGLNAAGGGTSGQINAAELNISSATVVFDISGTLDDAAYVLATYTSKTGSTFASVNPPSGYQLDYAYNGGTQIALVPAPPSTGYGTWATANAEDQTANLDFDDDGVANGVEYFLGQTGSGFTTSPTSFNGTTVTWTNGGNIPANQYGTQFVIQTSTDLVVWSPVLAGNPNLNNQSGSVSFTLTGPDKQFVRMLVTPD